MAYIGDIAYLSGLEALETIPDANLGKLEYFKAFIQAIKKAAAFAANGLSGASGRYSSAI